MVKTLHKQILLQLIVFVALTKIVLSADIENYSLTWRVDCHIVPRAVFRHSPMSSDGLDRSPLYVFSTRNPQARDSNILRIARKIKESGKPAETEKSSNRDYRYAVIATDEKGNRILTLYLDIFKPEGLLNGKNTIFDKMLCDELTGMLEETYKIFVGVGKPKKNM